MFGAKILLIFLLPLAFSLPIANDSTGELTLATKTPKMPVSD